MLYLISGPATPFHRPPRRIFARTRSLPIASRPGRITAAVASPRLIPRRIRDIGPRGFSGDSSNTGAVSVAAAGDAAKDFAAKEKSAYFCRAPKVKTLPICRSPGRKSQPTSDDAIHPRSCAEDAPPKLETTVGCEDRRAMHRGLAKTESANRYKTRSAKRRSRAGPFCTRGQNPPETAGHR